MMNFEIGELHPSTPHLFSDFIELYVLLHTRDKNFLSESDIESLLSTGIISTEDEVFIEENEDKQDNEESSAEKVDRAEVRIENVFELLEYRQNFFNDFYPFEIEKGEIIRLTNSNFTNLAEKQKLYIFLLACSRLRSFKSYRSQTEQKSVIQLWAKYFTELGKIAFKELLPSWADVYIFDANSEDRRNIFGTNLRDALKRLGQADMIFPCNLLNDNIEREHTSGDAGLDLIGVGNFNDKAISNVVIFGQCGAQETNWPSKTLEGHPIHLSNYFHMQPSYTNCMLIPLSYRSSNGSFVNANKLGGTLLLDRSRILDLSTKNSTPCDLIDMPWMRNFIRDFDYICNS